MTVTIVGGDRRQQILMTILRDKGFSVGGFFDETHSMASSALARRLAVSDVVILPIPVTRDGKTVAGTALSIESMLKHVKSGAYLFGGRLPDNATRKDLHLIDYLCDESFTQENAALTAEGVLRLLYENTERALADAHILIFGFGRIGSHLTHRLIKLGARVTVVARRQESRTLAAMCGAVAIGFGEKLPHADFAVNTVPPPISLPAPVPKGELPLIELAGLERAQIPDGYAYIAAPSLPGKLFPYSAADRIFAVTLRYLKGESL